MSIVGLIILTIIWAVYLGWYMTQSKSNRQSGDSIASFRNQLAILERRGPGSGSRDFLGTAAGNLPLSFGRSGGSKPSMSLNGGGFSSVIGRSRSALNPVPGTLMSGNRETGNRPAGNRMGNTPSPRGSAMPTLSGVRKRRRDILIGLLSIAGATLVFGILPSLRMLWLAHLAVDGLLVAYVVMLIQVRNQAAERELKVRFLPAATSMPSMMQREPSLMALRRTAVN